MTALTHRPSAVPNRAAGNISPVRKEPHLVESVYRTVTALRADPRFADEALPPDAYLAVVDSIAPLHAAERHSDEFSRRIDPRGLEEPQS